MYVQFKEHVSVVGVSLERNGFEDDIKISLNSVFTKTVFIITDSLL